jgi:hypothetical protein
MGNLREAAQALLDVLDQNSGDAGGCPAEIEALRAALAAPVAFPEGERERALLVAALEGRGRFAQSHAFVDGRRMIAWLDLRKAYEDLRAPPPDQGADK